MKLNRRELAALAKAGRSKSRPDWEFFLEAHLVDGLHDFGKANFLKVNDHVPRFACWICRLHVWEVSVIPENWNLQTSELSKVEIAYIRKGMEDPAVFEKKMKHIALPEHVWEFPIGAEHPVCLECGCLQDDASFLYPAK